MRQHLIVSITVALSHASRARFSYFRYPGVPLQLRSTPGFMLSPASRVLEVTRLNTPMLMLTALFKPANALLDLACDLFDLRHVILAQVEGKLVKKRLDWRVMRVQ